MASKIVPGDLWVGMRVWPTPRTLLAQPICYQQPRCAIIALHWPYVEVRRAPRQPGTNGIRYPRIGPSHRIHVDNLLRRDPHFQRAASRTNRRTPPIPTGGHEQLSLF
ncbi:hypothetical protein [Actinoplanes flavus]|uniref:Uncharacterized protein n=1 Tax=Actinoplanes flavus TaxID=2820290 RepID=A0ABS3UD05_9ACTN|nr:hypothetical protein [Actinoplanes flavus]MBO3736655.1 hypothetical protein [Actinoplanes flavus]